MANYGEELVYWYLRLNGFFMIQNFVLNREEDKSVSNVDVLAVRFPHVHETVGGMEEEWHGVLSSLWEGNWFVGLICEIKTGPNIEIEDVFRNYYNLERAIARLGFFERRWENFDVHVAKAYKEPITKIDDKYKICKVLFAESIPSKPNNCLTITLDEVEQFIKRRLQRYRENKFRDRMFYKSALFQYMAWQEVKPKK